MPRITTEIDKYHQPLSVDVNNFVGGLVSDFHELNTPPNTTTDEKNVDLDRRGNRKRRLGIDFEAGYQASVGSTSLSDWPTLYMKTSKWLAVAEDGNTNFLVIQTGKVLSFYDLGNSTTSAGAKSFTIDLSSFAIAGAINLQSQPVQTAYGKGLLFVTGPSIDPFYVTYDPNTDTITTTKTVIQIRDLDRQDHSLAYTDQPTTLTAAQKYDLYNQGWGAIAPCHSTSSTNPADTNRQVLDWYYFREHKYPSLSKTWWLGKIIDISDGRDLFVPSQLDSAHTGNMLAPLGSFILDAFYQDRSTVSGIPGLPVVVDNTRPSAVAFYSGRVWYGHNNQLYFSQLLADDNTVAGFCYQSADPTAEKINDLVATDGGVLKILNAGTIFAMVPFENSLFIFATNGVWVVGGSSIGAGFTATDFSVYKVTEAGALSARSIVSVEGLPVWWSKLGIYSVVSEPAKQGYSVRNLVEKKLQNFYEDIPPISKLNATGDYDTTKKTISWLYNSTTGTLGNNPYVCDTILNFSTLFQAFYPYSLPTASGSPLVVDVFNVLDIVASETLEDVLTTTGATITDNASATVQIEAIALGNAENTDTSLKFLTFFSVTGS